MSPRRQVWPFGNPQLASLVSDGMKKPDTVDIEITDYYLELDHSAVIHAIAAKRCSAILISNPGNLTP
jgi:hypothetical protein